MNKTADVAHEYSTSPMQMLHEYEVVHTPQFMREAREQTHIKNSRLLGSLDVQTSRRYDKALAMHRPRSSITAEVAYAKTQTRSKSDNFLSRVEDTSPGHVRFRDYILKQPPRSKSTAHTSSMQNYGWQRDIEHSAGGYDYYEGSALTSSPTSLTRNVGARDIPTRRIGRRKENAWRPAGHGDPEWSEYREKEDREDQQS